MVLFAGAGICLWVMVFWSVCLTTATQSRAKVLNICADNAGGGSMVIVRRWKSGGEWTIQPHNMQTGRAASETGTRRACQMAGGRLTGFCGVLQREGPSAV